jgi:PAS domain S-box-containing protein
LYPIYYFVNNKRGDEMGDITFENNTNELNDSDRSGKHKVINIDLQEQINLLQEKLLLAEGINDASIDRILAVDVSMRVIAWNTMCEKVTGISKDRIMGKSLVEFFPEIKTNDAIEQAIEMAMKGIKMFVPADKGWNDREYCEHHFVPLKSKNGEVLGVLNIIHDVAHRVKAENELKALNKSLVKKNKELRQKNAEIASFNYVASHDLKEPLRKIYTFIELLLIKEVDNLGEQGKNYFRRIQGSAKRMSLLTDDILAFTELNSSRKILSDVCLNNVFNKVKDNLKDTIKSKNAIVEADTLPVIKGYESILEVLFQQLIGNALKFQSDGNAPHVRINFKYTSGRDIKHMDTIKDVEYIQLSFIDNGMGFDMIYVENIFKMFKRLHGSDTFPGTGIGLTLCKKIVELHGGFITAESCLGEGSTFHCFLQLNLK